ncbi:MAG: hypothetical protein EBU90_23830, partial [Proteobacteria bacterium]|nr:hypothetical protein [Pseudomonadota bacterium]
MSDQINKYAELLGENFSSMKELQELSLKQKKIAKLAGDPNKLDAADFAALRAGEHKKDKETKKVAEDYVSDAQRKAVWADRNEKKKKVKEETEQLDEISKKTLSSYAHKATDAAQDSADADYDSHYYGDGKHKLKIANRLRGLSTAGKKLGDSSISHDVKTAVKYQNKKNDAYADGNYRDAGDYEYIANRHSAEAHSKIKKASGIKEETKQLDELSKTALGRYMRRAVPSAQGAMADVQLSQTEGGFRKSMQKLDKRNRGIMRAVDKLAKEEVELDESDAYDKDRYAVKNGKAVKDNPGYMGSPNYKDQPHHVWATS